MNVASQKFTSIVRRSGQSGLQSGFHVAAILATKVIKGRIVIDICQDETFFSTTFFSGTCFSSTRSPLA
jgi:hypothetical protein